MKARSKKFLSLLLATAMVFTLNTTVFAEEVAVDSVDDAVEATVDEVAEEATVDAVDENTQIAADGDANEQDGFKFTVKDGKATAVTTIDYASNGDKKNEKFNVAIIKNTTDPVSWNNSYASDLITTVLYGSKGQDDWLNNNSKVTVSSSNPGDNARGYVEGDGGYDFNVPNLKLDENKYKYQVIPVVEGSQYIFVGYGVATQTEKTKDDRRFNFAHVAGYDEAVAVGYGYTYPETIPTTEWDGRQVDFNKSGKYKFTTSKKEALDVALAFVTYANGTVTEVNGVNAGSVKVDKKNQKAASVYFDTSVVSKTIKGNNDKGELGDVTTYFEEHKTLGNLPFFTIKPSVKGTDAKSYKKDITAKLKDKKFYFGIVQNNVDVTSTETGLGSAINVYDGLETVSDPNALSENDAKKAEEGIAKALTEKAAYDDKDVEKAIVDDFEVTKFTDKGATVTLQGYVGEDNSYKKENLKALSGKGKNAEYSLESGTVAGESISYLKFTDNGNYVYTPMAWSTDANGDVTKDSVRIFTKNGGNLAPAGFKWAFRKSPVEKSKKFRYGVFKSNNQGFVYSVDETAVDSVEEAF